MKLFKKSILTAIFAATTFLGIIPTAQANEPPAGYVVIKIVNNNPGSDHPLEVNKIWTSTPSDFYAGFGTVSGKLDKMPLTYTHSTYVKYWIGAPKAGAHNAFNVLITLKAGENLCDIQVAGNTIDDIDATKKAGGDSSLCNTLSLDKSGIKDKTLTFTVNYNGPLK